MRKDCMTQTGARVTPVRNYRLLLRRGEERKKVLYWAAAALADCVCGLKINFWRVWEVYRLLISLCLYDHRVC